MALEEGKLQCNLSSSPFQVTRSKDFHISEAEYRSPAEQHVQYYIIGLRKDSYTF